MMKSKGNIFCSVLMLLLHSLFAFGNTDNALEIVDLRSEYISNPVGIDDPQPQLSWRLASSARGTMQAAYRILVASSPELLLSDKGDMWDSGKVISSQSAGILYRGVALSSRKRYYWKVKVWTDRETAGEWSAPAFFEMGLMHQEDWTSSWIAYVAGVPGRTLYFKGTMKHNGKTVKNARMYISGIGFYEVYINGKKAGDHVLDPAQSTYSKRVYYVTHDVSQYLSEPEDGILIVVAPGWNGAPKLRTQLEVTYTDGSHGWMTSNEFRTFTTGPVMYSSIFDGEYYDARLENPELYKANVPAGRQVMNRDWGWAYYTDEPGGKMAAQKIEPIKVVETITPVDVKEPAPGVYVFDAGQNMAGWAALKVQGKAGTKVTLRFAETLETDGYINQRNLRFGKAEDTYILNGTGIETWEPAFTYHGFRYVQVEGLPRPPQPGDILIKRVRTAVDRTGDFRCSNPLLNDIYRMVVNTEASNLHSVPTDCPQRDERMGWLNDLTVRIEQAIYNFDMSRFFPKFIIDIRDTQDSDGSITCVAPFRFGNRPADPVCASYLLLAQKCYAFYGNKRMIADHFDGMKAWTDYLYAKTENGIVNYSYYGDWCPPAKFGITPGSPVSKDTPGKLISTGYLYYCARLLSDMAKVIDRDSDARQYQQLAAQIAAAFNREYWHEETGGYASNNQACNSFALYMGLADEKKTPRVVANLVEDVKKNGYHLTTGNLCTKYLLEVLTENGHHETAYKIAAQTTYPSWGFMLQNGATTLWERWEYLTSEDMNSHNHPMMGSVGSWFYRYVLGIIPDFEHPAFERFTVKPYMFDELTFAEGELSTVKGVIRSEWKRDGNRLSFRVGIPPNTVAAVYVPAKSAAVVTENNAKVGTSESVKFLKEEKGYAVFQIGSGDYHFQSKL
jgi:alpha-L-rhamnosidase